MASDAKHRLLFLDGVRGWAALMVLLFHVFIRFLSPTTPAYRIAALRFITDGQLAVFIFFTVSGFALTVKFRERPDFQGIVRETVTRYFRLTLPIFITSFFAYVFMKAHLLYNLGIAQATHSPQWLGSFFNFEPSFGGLLGSSFFWVFIGSYRRTLYNPNLWTMTTEFQGSILIFILAALCLPNADGKKTLSWRWPLLLFFPAIIFPDLDCFIFGFLLAGLYRKKIMTARWIGAAAAALFAALVYYLTFFKPANDYILGFSGMFLVGAVSFSPHLKGFFSSRLSVFLGTISFPLYLIHILVICSFSSWLFGLGVSVDTIAALTVAVSLIAAWILVPMEEFSINAAKWIGNAVCGQR